MKAKRILAFGLIAVMTVTLSACGGKDGGSSNNQTDHTDSGSTQDRASDGGDAQDTGSGGGSLVTYTNSGSDGRDAWLKNYAKENGFDVEVVQIQGGDLGNRIVSEKNNVQADLVFGLNNVEYEKLKAEDTLEQWEPAWKDEVDLSLGDADGYYYPLVIQPLVNIMNADLDEYPKDYTDLTDEKWKDKYTILNFGGGTGKTILASLLVRYQDPDGEAGISEEGWEFVKNWVQNGHMETEGEDYVGGVIDGSHPICEMWGSGVLQNEQQRDYKFEIMSPEIGVPYVTEQIAVLKGTDSKDRAVEFANWFGSAETQTAWMEQFGTVPCQKAAFEKAADNVKEFVGKVHQQDIDWEFVAQNLDQWVEKVELEFM